MKTFKDILLAWAIILLYFDIEVVGISLLSLWLFLNIVVDEDDWSYEEEDEEVW